MSVEWVSATGIDIVPEGTLVDEIGEHEIEAGNVGAVIGEDFIVVIEADRERLIEIFSGALEQLGVPRRRPTTIL